MPLGRNVRYRVKTNSDGSKTRLAFKGSEVVETKKLEKGARAKKTKKKNEYSEMASEYKKKRGY